MSQNYDTVFCKVTRAYERCCKDNEFWDHVEVVGISALRTFGIRVGVVALLHDVLEDEIMTQEQVETLGVDEEQMQALHLLTHNKSEKSYNDYIFDLQKSEIAVKVKLCDAMNNFQRCVDGGDFRRAMKYSKVVDLMTIAIANKHWEK